MKNKTLFAIFLFSFLTACTTNRNHTDPIKTVAETITISDEQILNQCYLSSIIDTALFIKLESDPNDNFRIKRISFSDQFIFVLWERSNSICVYNRKGDFLIELNRYCNQLSFADPSNLFYDSETKLLYILYEDCVIVKCNLALNGTIKSITSEKIPINSVNDIVKIPGSDFFGLSLHNAEIDLILTSSLSMDRNHIFREAKIPSSSNKTVVLRNAFVTDGQRCCFRKYMNDTVYAISDLGLFPLYIFDFKPHNSLNSINDNEIFAKHSAQANFFFFIDNTFYLKYSINRKDYFLIRSNNGSIHNFSLANLENDIYGSLNLNCIGVDPITKTYVFYSSSLLLNRHLESSFINRRYETIIKKIETGVDDKLILVLLTFNDKEL